MAENAIGKPLLRVGLNDQYAHGASKMYLLEHYHLDAMELIKKVEKIMGKDLGIKKEDLEAIRFEDFSEV